MAEGARADGTRRSMAQGAVDGRAVGGGDDARMVVTVGHGSRPGTGAEGQGSWVRCTRRGGLAQHLELYGVRRTLRV